LDILRIEQIHGYRKATLNLNLLNLFSCLKRVLHFHVSKFQCSFLVSGWAVWCIFVRAKKLAPWQSPV